MQKIDRSRSALLLMDFQNSIVPMLGENKEAFLARVATIQAAARKANIPVFYVVVGFREGCPEISDRNKAFSAIKARDPALIPTLGQPSTEVVKELTPLSTEVIVVKHRFGPFLGTNLEILLRAHNVENLILCGISTSGVVLSTVRYAADMDYRIFVVRDGCADSDAEVHNVLMDKVFQRQAFVVSAEEVLAELA